MRQKEVNAERPRRTEMASCWKRSLGAVKDSAQVSERQLRTGGETLQTLMARVPEAVVGRSVVVKGVKEELRHGGWWPSVHAAVGGNCT